MVYFFVAVSVHVNIQTDYWGVNRFLENCFNAKKTCKNVWFRRVIMVDGGIFKDTEELSEEIGAYVEEKEDGDNNKNN